MFVFDLSSAPSTGAITSAKRCYQVPASTTYGVRFAPPLAMSNGVIVAFSTGADCWHFTPSATAFIAGEAQ